MTAINPASRGNRQFETRVVADNRQAGYLYHIEGELEAGIMLMGWEVKAILAGQANFNGGSAFVRMIDGEAFLDALTITPLPQAAKGQLEDLQPSRHRKLLLRRPELDRLTKYVTQRGYTVVPLALTYNGLLKVKIGLAKGKKQFDKRETIKLRDEARANAREAQSLAA